MLVKRASSDRKLIAVRFRSPSKADSPMVVVPPMLTQVREVTPRKACAPIVSKESGRVREERWDPTKA